MVPPRLTRQAVASLRVELAATLADDSVRILVLRSHHAEFCSGMDLAEVSAETAHAHAPAWHSATEEFVAILRQLMECAPVTVAVVDGPALGGGVGLLAACDLVLATERASFALPELLVGLVPAMILPVLAERLGLHQAKRWAITLATWQAEEARTKGLVDEVVLAAQLEMALKKALRGLQRAHPRGVIALKRFVRQIEGLGARAAMAEGQTLLAGLLTQTGVRAEIGEFVEFGILPSRVDN